MKVPELGIGLTYHPVLDRVLENHAGLIQVLEIEPQTHWVQPDPTVVSYAIDEPALRKIKSYPFHKLMHSIGFPVGGSRAPDEIEYPLHHAMIDALGVPWMSEHLSFNKAECNGREFVTNYMLPPLQTPAGVQAAAETIRVMRSNLPVPVAVETGVNYLRTIPGHISDGAFIRQVVEEGDCFILLDLHNILTNEINGRQPMEAFLAEIPLERVVELHVAGGKMRGDYYIDSHSGKIPDHLLATAKKLIPDLPNLGAIIFEIFPDYLADIGSGLVQKDLEYLNRLWDNRKRRRRPVGSPASKLRPAADPSVGGNRINTVSPREWEDTLAALVTHQPTDCPFKELTDDPAIGLIAELIESFRASMVSESFRYTARLLMINLGVDVYEKLLADFWKGSTPEPFASTEGANFIRYIESAGVSVYGLPEIIAFEKAYLATLIDGAERVVPFPFDPLSFMKALGEGRKPHKIYEGNYELAIEARQGVVTHAFHHQAVAH
jgi:uncharacterized protein (UPF0276 family)